MSRIDYLLSSVAIGSCLIATGALAQGQAIEEVVVTATRQADTISKVPFTVQAITQQKLDQEGVETVADLVREVPGLNVSTGTGTATFSIRGVVGGTGAATTSVYLDDTNLTKRANGGVFQENGAPVPLLYDLDRVEVLKGPQGTLYGGSSEGGTVRYITPKPSLNQFSAQARVEGSDYTDHGAPSWEFGGEMGGPIVTDKVGLRVSVINQEQGGYIDVINPYNNQLIQADANSSSSWATRASLFAKLTDNFTAQLSEYYTSTYSQGGPGGTTSVILPNGQPAPAGQTFTVPAMCITGSYRNLTTQPLAVPGGAAAASVIPPNAPCTPATQATAAYVRPGMTYGPVNLGRYDTIPSSGPYPGAGRMAVVGSNSNFSVTGLTLNYSLPHEVTATSITSYLKDYGYGTGAGGEEYVSVAGAAQTTSNLVYTGCASAVCRGFPLYAAYPANSAIYQSTNTRNGVEEELRLTSAPTSRPVSWVAGLFFADETTNILYTANVPSAAAQNAYLQGLYGPGETGTLRYGVSAADAPYSYLNARIHDTELAGYGEGNYYLTSKLKLIAGVRISRVGLDYNQLNYGQVNDRLATSLGSVTQGSSVNVPVTPKFGAQYQMTDTDMAYFTAAQGFRAGGVNAALNQNACGPYLANYGLTASTVPTTYNPDSVWSYELGSKFRALDSKLQINVAAFRIDWSQIQATISLPCGQSFVTGGGAARSEGGELEAQFRPVAPLLLTLNLGYTHAYYVTPVGGINGVLPQGSTASIKAGDAISGAPPPIQLAASAQYSFTSFAKYDSYFRADYTYSSMFASGPSFGSTGYNALSHYTYARDQLNLRLGARIMKSLDANIFAVNVFDAQARIGGPSGGRTCSYTSPDCSTGYTLFNPFITQTYQPPRRVGIQINYRY